MTDLRFIACEALLASMVGCGYQHWQRQRKHAVCERVGNRDPPIPFPTELPGLLVRSLIQIDGHEGLGEDK